MTVIFSRMFKLCLCLVILACFLGVFLYYLLSRSVPDYTQTLDVSGLEAPVEIVRDYANVPHILAKEDQDSFFALGYVHAQDRLWQMILMRRVAQGRLSELFGERTLRSDKMMRSLDVYAAAQSSLAAQDTQARTALEAYAAGVNAWLNEIQVQALGRGAPEMWLFNHPIAPWVPADSLAILKLMALQLSSHFEREILRARLSLAVGPQRMQELLADPPGAGIAELADYRSGFTLDQPILARASLPQGGYSPIKPYSLAGASNVWAVRPERSATRATMMANDPHLGYSSPSIWYLARMQIAGRGVIGASIPGIPLIMSGRSADIAWGVTVSYVDDQDLFLEELHPDDRGQYRTQDGWSSIDRRSSIIGVKNAPSVTVDVAHTRNGVMLPEDVFRVENIIPNGHKLVLSATALSTADTSFSAASRLMYARSAQEGMLALEGVIAPALNVTVIDQDMISMVTAGALPARDAAHQSQGLFPSFGYRPENQWKGVLAEEHRPIFINPTSGILGNTNNKIVDRPFPYHLSYEWGDTQRINRLQRLMGERQLHTRDSFIEMQQDIVSYSARALLPLVAADLWFTEDSAPEGTLAYQRKMALSLLASWNGEMSEHLPEPLLYSAWMRALQERLIRDDLGLIADDILHVEPLFIERVFRDVDGAAKWCDVVQSSKVESCAQIASQSLDDALIELDATYGGALETLRWGDAHAAVHQHSTLGEVPLLSWFVNIEHPMGGGDQTLQRAKTRGGKDLPFQNVSGAGYKGIYNLSDPDSSLFIMATGQSGHPLSPFYDNLSRLWRQGEYLPMSLDVSLARAASVGVTQLRPVGGTGP